MTGQEFAQKYGTKLLAISHDLRKIRDEMNAASVKDQPAQAMAAAAAEAQGKLAEAIMLSVYAKLP